MNQTTTTTTFKVVDARNSAVVKENLEWHQAMYWANQNERHYTIMEMDADIEERLERRRQMIARMDAR